MILIGAVGRRDKRTGVDDEHLVAPEPLGQYLVGFRRAAAGGLLAYGGEGQPTTHRYGLGQLRREEIRCQLVRSLTTTGRLSSQRLRDGTVKMQRQCHGISVTANARHPYRRSHMYRPPGLHRGDTRTAARRSGTCCTPTTVTAPGMSPGDHLQSYVNRHSLDLGRLVHLRLPDVLGPVRQVQTLRVVAIPDNRGLHVDLRCP